ncbi:MAG: tyrosine--tRNA ligase [Candidatus Pacebacteria bacterium]|nr:tyrosine--tRNA ligase [Candidatus Paceibacterota bacterium]
MWPLQKKINTDPKKINEILSRGVSNVVDKEHLQAQLLSGKRLRIKLGIDPTSPNIHLGRAVLLLKLKDFQDLGHKVILLIGDTTGVIGDTSDKTSERPLLSREEVKKNAQTYFSQIGKVVNLKDAEQRRNSEWLLKLGYNDIGEHADQFSLADFIARENIKKRLDEGKRVSLREMLYPLMQGYDSVALRADVELGGNDQWFNLLAGRKLQERFGQEPQDILTTNLILGTDGRKMSSSWGNTINLLDVPEDMYGKIMSIPDELIESYLVHCTRVPMARVEEIKEAMLKGENPRDFKMELAHAIVALYHGEDAAKSAEESFVNVFQKKEVGEIDVVKVSPGVNKEVLKDALIDIGLVKSGNEFNRLIKDGAITRTDTGEKIDPDAPIKDGTYKIGKRRFVAVNVKN